MVIYITENSSKLLINYYASELYNFQNIRNYTREKQRRAQNLRVAIAIR